MTAGFCVELVSASRIDERLFKSSCALMAATLLVPLEVVPEAGASFGSMKFVGCGRRPLADNVNSPNRARAKFCDTVSVCVVVTRMPS